MSVMAVGNMEDGKRRKRVYSFSRNKDELNTDMGTT